MAKVDTLFNPPYPPVSRCHCRLLLGEDKPALLSTDWSTWIDEEKDGVRWNDVADRPWEWWKHEEEEEEEEEDEHA